MALWTPADLAVPPLVWFDASDAPTVFKDGASKVGSWANKGSLGGSANGPGGQEPTYTASGLNGLPALNLSGAKLTLDATIRAGLPSVGANSTMAMVASNTSSGAEQYAFFHGALAAGQGRLLYKGASGAAGLSTVASGNALMASQSWGSSGDVVIGRIAGASRGLSIVVDGNAAATSTASSAINTDNSHGSIGSLTASEGGLWSGFVQAALVLGYLPTSDEQARLEGYFAWKWGLQGKLPAGHAYKNAAPESNTGVVGNAAYALELISSAASSKVPVSAASVGALGAIISQGAASLVALAASAVTLQPIASAAFARSTLSGAATVALSDVAGAASAAAIPTVGALAAVTFQPVGSTATAQSALTGSASSQLAQINVSSAGGTAVAATGAGTIGNVEVAAVGRPVITAVAAPQLALIASTASAGAQASLVAASAATLAAIASSSTAQVTIAAATLANLAAISSSSGAAAPVRATGAMTLGSVTSLAASHLELSAAGAAQFAQLGSISAGYVVTRAAASVLLGSVGGSASASAGDGEPSAGIAGPCWTAVVRPRLFSAAVTPRRFTAFSTGCKRMITFPGKYAHEVRHAAVDFAPALASGEELIGSPTVVVVRGSLLTSAGALDGSKVRFTLSGGSSKPSPIQRIEVRCPTSTGQTLEEIVSVTMLSG